METIDWATIDANEIAASEANYARLAKWGSANRDFYGAALFAQRNAQKHDLLPRRNADGEMGYTTEQSVTASCFTRHDIVAILAIQLSILKRLQGLRFLAWSCLILLGYIAYRLS